ncbi:MAG TPA: universal stress protein [Nitrospirota bacterium]|nr:universal stress protein [Nitrospirota bacterium]
MTTAPMCPIGKLETLLLATDMSEFSDGAIREAIAFASKCSSKIHASMTLETNPEYETVGSNVFAMEEKEAMAHLQAIKARCEREGITCDISLHESDETADVLVEEAAAIKADMIVIGRRGRKGMAKAFMGETAASVIGHAPCKVLVVPRAAQIDYRNILVAVDGSAHAQAAVEEAIAIAKRTGSSLITLSAMRNAGEREEARKHAEAAAETAWKAGVPAEAVTPTGRSADAIVETAAGRGVNLIVMGTYGRTGVKKLFMGSATEKVIGSAGCAVLVVKA